ncbi:MAG: PAS domain S-box protein, partial [Proteobacteria bacterium]|nr:PAS domain S-box protein [Pseudomonadota bacterium]
MKRKQQLSIVNTEFEKLSGYSKEEVEGKMRWTDFVVKEDLERMEKYHAERREKGGEVPTEYEFRFIDKQGNIKDIINNVIMIPGIKGSVASLMDITSRKQAENALRESEEKYRTLTETATDIIFTLDTKGKFTYINPETEKSTGYTVQDLIGHPFTEVLAPEYIKSTVDRFRQGLSGETIPIYEVELLHKNGKKVPVELNVTSLLDADGKPIGRIGIARDITERKRADEEIKVSENRFRELFNNMSNGVAVYEAKDDGNDFIFKDLNRAGERIENIKKEDLMGKNVLEMFPGVKEFGLFDIFKRVWETGKPKHHPISLYKDKRIVGWRENYIYKLHSGEIVTVYDDVSKRKQAEEALEQSEERYRTLVEESFDGIFVQKGPKIIFTNKRLNEMLGYDEGELLGLDHWLLYHPEYQDLTRQHAQARMRGEMVTPQYEVKLQRKDGSWLYGEVSARVM